MQHRDAGDWPILKEYNQDHLARIALPLGGIGTGTVSIGGRGDLRDWEIMNRPAKGFVPRSGRNVAPFFALFVKSADGTVTTRAIEGPIELEDYEGATGCVAPNHGLPRFRQCGFATAYPLGQVLLSDPDVPVKVRIEAFNPLIPGNSDASGIPIAILRFVLTNHADQILTASICGSLPNFIGADSTTNVMKANRNLFRTGEHVQGIFMDSEGVDPGDGRWGTMALTTVADARVSYRTAWANLSWGDSLLDFWDDFSEDGALEERESPGVDSPMASLATGLEIAPGETQEVTFLITWHFPNRQTWTPTRDETGSECCEDPNRIGNYYATCYSDAWDVAEQILPRLPELETETVRFVRAFCETSLPEVVKEAALFNLANLRSQTCFRTEDGRFFGWEGCHDHGGCCHGSCTHVWNYEQATAFLFGELAQSMRNTEFTHAMREDGLMSFRVNLPMRRAMEFNRAAADGQMGCLMKLYRDWQLSGDDELLRELWPGARKALEFCWLEGGWDADHDGVMEGCQHNTMDVEYYGPNPQMGAWYLGALRAGEEMARYLGETEFAERCHALFENGRQWIDEHLFNNEYYEHEIRPPEGQQETVPGLQVGMGAHDLTEPELQLGAGCLVDQLVGQYMAHVCGLGYLLDPQNIRQTLLSIMKYNFKQGFHDHFNHMRSYVLGDESALLMATYPLGRRPKRPFPYYNEVMTGFEYSAAIHMLYEGQTENGLRCIGAIRDRYDGRKRNPFNEAECGHHYARAMASWAAVLALTGFHYSGVDQAMTFTAQDGSWFWSNGYAWGTCHQKTTRDGIEVNLHVLHGTLTLKRLELVSVGEVVMDAPRTIRCGEHAHLVTRR